MSIDRSRFLRGAMVISLAVASLTVLWLMRAQENEHMPAIACETCKTHDMSRVHSSDTADTVAEPKQTEPTSARDIAVRPVVEHSDPSKHYAPFIAWLEEWKSGKAELSEGLALAKKQQPVMLGLIEKNPDLAHSLAISEADWNSLPEELRVHVARRFSGEGTYYAIHTCDSGISRHITLDKFSSNDTSISPTLLSHVSYKGNLTGVALGKRYGLVAMEGGGVIEREPPSRSTAYSASEGAITVLWLSIKASNQSSYPDSVSGTQGQLNTVAANYAAWSYGSVSMTHTVIEVDIPSASGAAFGTIQSEGDTAAAGAGENVADYDVVIYRTSWEGNWAWIGDKYVFAKKNNASTILHEIGHCMGLHHSNWWKVNGGQPPWGTGVNQIYGEVWDAMAYSNPRGDFSVPEKIQLGWLDPGTDYVDDVGTGVYRIYDYTTNSRAFSTAGVDGAYYGVSVFKDTSAVNGEWDPRRYVLSYRDRTNVGSKNMTRGLYLHWKPWTYNGSSGYNVNGAYGTDIIDVHTAANGVNDALLAVGETYVDNDTGNRDGDIFITVLSKSDPDGTPETGDEYLDVKVVVGDQTGNQVPTGSLSFAKSIVQPGEAAVMTVSASDSDGDILAYHWDFGLGTTVTDYHQMPLDGSSTQQFTYATEGVYTVDATISDGRGGTLLLSQDILVSTNDFSAPAVSSFAVTGITETNAQLIGWLTSTGGSATVVSCYWNANTDPGTTTTGWDYSTSFGTASSIGKYTNDTAATASLVSGSTYYYRYRAANEQGTNWSSAASFTTIASPVVDNSIGSSYVSQTSATLRGLLSSGSSASSWICWGLTEEGTTSTGDWPNVIFIGSVDQGVPFSTNVTGLATNVTYWYRCYVTNTAGTAWSDTASTFSGTPVGAGAQTSAVMSISEVFCHNEKGNYGGIPSDMIGGTGMNGNPFDQYAPPVSWSWPTNDPSVWTPTSSHYADEWQSQSLLNPATSDNAKIGWAIFDLGDAHALEDFYIWNVRENNQRYSATFNVYVAAAPTVAPTHGPTDSTSTDYVFSGGGWTKINGSALNGSHRGNQIVSLGGANARYVAVEILTNGGDASKAGLAEVAIVASVQQGSLIGNLPATGITNTAATFNASLDASGTNYDVYVYYGKFNGSTNAVLWDATNSVGSFNDVSTNVSYNASLTADQTYYYTFMASNTSEIVWATPSWQFETLAAGPSLVTTNYSVPYSWLVAKNITNDFEAAVTNDHDNDGFPTWKEYWSGTDPTNSDSYLHIAKIQLVSTNIELTWEHASVDVGAIPDVTIKACSNLAQPAWFAVGTNTPTNGTSIWYGAAPQRLFYRLSVTNAP